MRDITSTRDRAVRITQLRGSITLLDEVLTMSAKMAAATGDKRWAARYDDAAPKLDVAIGEALALATPAIRAQVDESTNEANKRLVDLETQAFARVNDGDLAGADAILNGGDYGKQKLIYAEGMRRFGSSLDDLIQAKKDEEGRRARTTYGLAFAGVALILTAGGLLVRTLVRWKRELLSLVAHRRTGEDERVWVEAEARAASLVVDSIGAGLECLARGDLSFRVSDALPEPYETLRCDLNRAAERLLAVMTEINVNTAAIRVGTGEIARAAHDLNRRTEQQAASLEETAATLDRITATTRGTAEGVQQAHDVVGCTKQDAERSGAVVSQAIAAMDAIETSSRQVGQIVSVIDEIAFQTRAALAAPRSRRLTRHRRDRHPRPETGSTSPCRRGLAREGETDARRGVGRRAERSGIGRPRASAGAPASRSESPASRLPPAASRTTSPPPDADGLGTARRQRRSCHGRAVEDGMVEDHWESFGIGFVTGMRSMTAAAALSWAASLGRARTGLIPGGIRPRNLATVAALAEIVGDKLPFAPDRRTPPSFLVRLLIGAAGGAAFSGPRATRSSGALAGMAGAVAGTVIGRAARGASTRSGTDWIRALAEDALAAGFATLLVRSAGRHDREPSAPRRIAAAT